MKPPHHILIAAAVNAVLAFLLPAHAQTTSSHECHVVPVGTEASDAAKSASAKDDETVMRRSR